MPRPPSKPALTVVAGLLCLTAVRAAEPVAESIAESGAPLELAEAIALAQSRHETPEIALARLERAQAVRRQAVAVLLPGLTLSGTYTRRSREVTREISGDTVTVQAIDALQGQAVADTTLFDLRALPLVRATKSGVLAQERESNELRRALAFDVAQGFLGTLSSERLLGAARERVRVAEETLRQTRIRLEAGLANRNDATRTELELATAQVVATQAANLVATARLGLSFLIDEPLTRRPLVDPVETQLPTGGIDALLSRAESGRDDLAALAERARQSRQLALVPRYGFAPRFDLRGLYRWTNEAGLSGREQDWNVAVNLTWEVFDGGERYALAAQRDAEAREAEPVFERTRREVERDVRQALADLDSAEAAVAQAVVRQQVARANAEEVHERFANGLASALEEADALASRFEADVEDVRQRFARSAAKLDLLRALGDWPLPRPSTTKPAAAPAPESTR